MTIFEFWEEKPSVTFHLIPVWKSKDRRIVYLTISRISEREIKLEKSEIYDFVENMKTTEHVILLYTNPEDKRRVLFTYLKAGLEKGEAAAYIAGEETPVAIKEAMVKFGIDVEQYEKSGALKVIDYRDWYIINGKFDAAKTIELWVKLLKKSEKKGFKGLKVTGEMICFVKDNMVDEVLEYERTLNRTLKIPLTAICAYDSEVIGEKAGTEVLLELLTTHSTAIIMGPKAGIVKTV